MAFYAVRRLGLAPCSEAEYKNIVKREQLVEAGDKKALAAFDKALADKQAVKQENGGKTE